MRIGILGPVEVEVVDVGTSIVIETAKERALLAILAARMPEVVSKSTLIDALWGDDPPATAERTLASHVSRLRRSIGASSVHGERGGYRLDDDFDVDAHLMTELVDEAAEALEAGRPEVAGRRADEARALWRGEPLADLADSDVRRGETVRLHELRHRNITTWIAAELALGHHEELIGEIENQIADNPLNEPMWGQLMIAMYRAGRQADALRAFERLRQTLRDQLGIDPTPALARVELQILRQDPRLDLVAPLPPNNLPGTVSSLIGRIDEIRSVSKMLEQHRIVTLVGPGGIGKSRLAIAVASNALVRYPDGVWWVDLAPAGDADALVTGLAAGLGLTDPSHFTLDRVIQQVARHPDALVVFDNCEHLRSEIADMVADLAARVPAVHILATSRERLALPGELRFVVRPLAVPPEDAEAMELPEFDAVRLLLDRSSNVVDATTTPGDLIAAGAICRLLDGVPLALELAASRTILFTLPQLASRLAERIAPITRANELHDVRYTSLDDAIAWSYDLLTPLDQSVFTQLSVFVGSFDLDAAAAVCRVDTSDVEPLESLAHLVDASLIDVDADPTSAATPDGTSQPTAPSARRCRLLAPIREYASGALSRADHEAVSERHARYFCDLASTLADANARLHVGAAQRYRTDAANFLAAFDWWRRHGDDTTRTFEFGLAFGSARYTIGDLDGSVRLLDEIGALPGVSEQRQGWAHYHLVWPLILLGQIERAAIELAAADASAARFDDPQLAAAVAVAHAHARFLIVGDIDSALPLYERAIEAGATNNASYEQIVGRLGLAQALVLSDRPEGVDELLAWAATALDAAPDDGNLAHLCLDRALLAWCTGDIAAIQDAALLGQRYADAAGVSYWKQINLTAEGFGLLAIGDHSAGEITLLRAARAALEDGNLMQFGIPLQGLAAIASLRGDFVTAARLLGASSATTPEWPLMQRRLAPYFNEGRAVLGDRFADEIERGRSIQPGEALRLALGVPNSSITSADDDATRATSDMSSAT